MLVRSSVISSPSIGRATKVESFLSITKAESGSPVDSTKLNNKLIPIPLAALFEIGSSELCRSMVNVKFASAIEAFTGIESMMLESIITILNVEFEWN